MSSTVWQVTIVGLLAVLAFDLALAIIRRNKETSIKEATAWTIFYVSAAIVFGYSLGEWNTTQARGEFFAGWITEYSLSVDNLFIFILILARFKIEKTKQQLVLLVGIIMALFLKVGETFLTLAPASFVILSVILLACSSSVALQVTSTTIELCVDSTTSSAVNAAPADETAAVRPPVESAVAGSSTRSVTAYPGEGVDMFLSLVPNN